MTTNRSNGPRPGDSAGLRFFDWREFEAEALDPANHIAFTPVPRARARRTGWSPDRQRLFLFALSRCGSVARAARSVGMSARSAYRLAHAPGADDFVRAWDEAIEEGIERVRQDALQDALGGTFVPVFRRGKLVRVEHRRSDRLALALLAGKPHDFADDYRRSMMSRREHKADLDEYDAAKAALDREGVGPVERRERLDEVVNRIVERIGERAAARGAGRPRIVRL
ncbi:MAG TPA: hypothetical protein VFK50_09670 [Sphingomicrobium sp.]|nr:hypothetical protein [Sphingomicrobium sp.]